MITKTCGMCGRQITVPDNRYKFCDPCKKARKKMFDYNAVQTYRQNARDRRKAQEKQNLELIEENRILRQQLRAMQSRIEALDALRRKELGDGR